MTSIKNFGMKRLNKKDFIGGSSMTTLQIVKKNNQQITFNDVSFINKYLSEQAEKNNHNVRVGIRALAIDKWTTLKAMDSELITEDEYDDYFINKVANISKFNKFQQLQFIVMRD